VAGPAQCVAAHRCTHAQVEALPAHRRVDVRRVAGQQHPAGPVALGQPAGVAEAGQPARCVHAEVGAGERAQPLRELLEGRRDRAVLGHPLGECDEAVHPVRVGAGPNRRCGVWTTAASICGGTPTSTSPSSHSTLAGSPGKPTPSSAPNHHGTAFTLPVQAS
jgi:hypothetical protein